MIARLLANLASRHAGKMVLLSALLTGLMAWAATGLRIHTSLTELLPEKAREVQDVHVVNEEVGGIGYLVAVIKGEDAEVVGDFANRFVEAVGKLPDVRYVEHHYDPEFFKQRALMLLTPAEIDELDAAVAARIAKEKRDANPLIVNLLDEEDEEEVPTLEELQKKYEARAPTRERLTSDEGRTAYVMIKPEGLAGDLAFGQVFVPKVRAMAAEMGAATGGFDGSVAKDAEAKVWVGLTGNYAIRVEENQVILRDLQMAAVMALLLSVGLVVVWTRRIRALLLVGLPLLAGVLWTGGIVALTVGEINIITGFLVAILFGLGVDFGIHLFMRFMEERRTGAEVEDALLRAIEVTGRATATGAATTAAAFYGLSFADFEGFSQFGQVAAVGVLIAFLATYLTAPPLYVYLDRLKSMIRPHRVKEDKPAFSNRAPGLVAGTVIVAVLGFAVFSVFSIRHIGFVTDFRKLQGTLPATVLLDEATEALGRTLAPAIIMTRGVENARKISEELHAMRDAQSAEGVVGLVLTLNDVVPPDQDARLARLKVLRETLSDPAVGTLPDEDRKKVEKAIALTNPPKWGVDDLPQYVRNRFLSPDGQEVMCLAAPVKPPLHISVLFAWADALTELRERVGDIPIWTADENLIAAKVFRLMRDDGPRVLLAAILAVFFLLFIDLRSPFRALLVLGPLLLGVLCIAGGMRLFGVDLNFLNGVMIPSIVGIGIDNAVHVYHRYRDEGRGSIGRLVRNTGSAAFLATTTTAIGFGTLVLAHHGGLRSAGELALIGMGACFIGTTVFFPALLWVMERTPFGPPEAPTPEAPEQPED
ncbi:MAG: MMPL family transporter [Deltaproteobacteria bacterium]|nr:MMPL family transporter [Deltaproteobacteria bacterium]